MPKLDTTKFATAEPREDADRPWLQVDPDKAFPAALAALRGSLSDLQIKLALAPRYVADEAGVPTDTLDAAAVELRTHALERARLFFTAELREKAGRPIGVHILRGENPLRWKL